MMPKYLVEGSARPPCCRAVAAAGLAEVAAMASDIGDGLILARLPKPEGLPWNAKAASWPGLGDRHLASPQLPEHLERHDGTLAKLPWVVVYGICAVQTRLQYLEAGEAGC